MRHATMTILGGLTLAAAACADSDGSIDIGGSTGSSLRDFAANWEGYAEAYVFSDGSDRVRLVLDSEGRGTVQVGARELLPPPSDPSVGYPPGPWNFEDNNGLVRLQPGFRYPIYRARVEAKRVRLDADSHDLWRDWCSMQTPIGVNSSGDHICVPELINSFGNGCQYRDAATGEPVQVDCLRTVLCQIPPPSPSTEKVYPVCQCSATSCAIRPVTDSYPVKIDGALEMTGAELVGTLAVDDIQERVTIRLTRK
jgi:hypothetical protein